MRQRDNPLRLSWLGFGQMYLCILNEPQYSALMENQASIFSLCRENAFSSTFFHIPPKLLSE